jgi:hypothetical protein
VPPEALQQCCLVHALTTLQGASRTFSSCTCVCSQEQGTDSICCFLLACLRVVCRVRYTAQAQQGNLPCAAQSRFKQCTPGPVHQVCKVHQAHFRPHLLVQSHTCSCLPGRHCLACGRSLNNSTRCARCLLPASDWAPAGLCRPSTVTGSSLLLSLGFCCRLASVVAALLLRRGLWMGMPTSYGYALRQVTVLASCWIIHGGYCLVGCRRRR